MNAFRELLDIQYPDTGEKMYHVLTDYSPKEWSNGDRPLPDHSEKNVRAIQKAMQEGKPIPIGSVIATLLYPPIIDHEEAGLLGAMMINRLHHLDVLVQQFYNPGIDVTLYAEDLATHVYFDHVSDTQTVEASQQQYLASVQKIISAYASAYNRDIVRLLKESELCASHGITYQEYAAQSALFQQMVFDYLQESGDAMDDTARMEALNTSLAQKTGWEGGVSKKTREFLAKRIIRSGQTSDEETADINWQIAGLMAVTLVKKKDKLIQKSMKDTDHLRISFVPNWPDSFKPNVMGLRISMQKEDRTPPWRAVLGIVVHEEEGKYVSTDTIKKANGDRTPGLLPKSAIGNNTDTHVGVLRIHNQAITSFPIFISDSWPA